ncbi:MAG: carbohydrate binding domain-containing protein, partial [Defluviitaleaceae bacterium]|nr:carbohydrate binding domain-containing protein [Defluviitaleaceae bacterium]
MKVFLRNSRKALACLLALAMVVTMGLPKFALAAKADNADASGYNLLTNGGFETGSGVTNWSSGTLMEVSNSAAHSGTYSVCVGNGASGKVAEGYDLQNGATYMVTYWAMIQSGSGTLQITPQFYNSQSNGDSFVYFNGRIPYGTWVEQVMTFTTPATGSGWNQMCVGYSGTADSAVYVDDFALYQLYSDNLAGTIDPLTLPGNNGGPQPQLDLQPDTAYILSGSALSADGTGLLQLYARDSDGGQLSYVGIIPGNNSYASGSDTFTTPSTLGGGNYLVIWSQGGSPDISVDNIALYQISPGGGSTPSAPFDGGLVLNGSFENGSSNWADWSGAFTVSTDEAKTGVHSGKLVTSGGQGFGQDYLNLQPNTTYTLSASVKVAGDIAANADYQNLSIGVQDTAENDPRSFQPMVTFNNGNIVSGGDWVTLTKTFDTPGTAVSDYQLYAWATTTDCTFYVDDISVVYVSGPAIVPTGPNVALNGDFETPDLTSNAGAAYCKNWDGADTTNMHVSDVYAHGGDYSMRLLGTGVGGNVSGGMRLQPNATYLLTCWALLGSGTGSLQVQPQFYNLPGTPPTITYGFPDGVNGTWVQLSETFDTPADVGTAYNQIMLYWGGSADSAVYVDDISVQFVSGGTITPPVSNVNLVPNGDMETNSGDSGTGLAYWGSWGADISPATDIVHGGSQSMHVQGAGGIGGGQWGLQMKPNTAYTMTASVYIVSGDPLGVFFKCINDSKDGATLQEEDQGFDTVGAWHTATWTFTTDDYLSSASPDYGVGFWSVSGGEYYIDDISIVESAALQNYVLNGSYEDLSADWNTGANYWGQWGGTALVSADQAYDGTHSLCINSTADGYAGAGQGGLALQPNTTYTVSAWVMRASGTGTLQISPQFWYNSSNSGYAPGPQYNFGGGNNVWSQVTFNFTTPSTAPDDYQALIWAPGPGVFYVDDYSIVQAPPSAPAITSPSELIVGLVDRAYSMTLTAS